MRSSPRRARVPPVDFGDKLLTEPSRQTFTPPRGRFLLRRWHIGLECRVMAKTSRSDKASATVRIPPASDVPARMSVFWQFASAVPQLRSWINGAS